VRGGFRFTFARYSGLATAKSQPGYSLSGPLRMANPYRAIPATMPRSLSVGGILWLVNGFDVRPRPYRDRCAHQCNI